jgi:hypothetical protein
MRKSHYEPVSQLAQASKSGCLDRLTLVSSLEEGIGHDVNNPPCQLHT